MFASPQAEHQWLDQLLGNWSFDHECDMPDGLKNKTQGTMTCRSLGGLWLICESTGDSSEDPWSSIMTLGFDPAQQCFVGTFIGSMMSNIWPYHGVLDPARKRLPLESKGPKFDGEGVGRYRDTIEIIDKNEWLFTSELENDHGDWVQFLLGRHCRV